MTTQKKKKKSWKDVPELVKKISALISAVVVIFTTLGSCLSWFENKITQHLDDRMSTLESKVNDIREDTIRIQLDNLINNDSENVESILTIARTYFIDMKGDWYMTEKFKRWGREHNVDLSDFAFTRDSSAS